MSIIVSFFLEFARVLVILSIGGGLLIGIETWIYSIAGIDILVNSWMPAVANIIIIFVVYRNVLQFRGWFKGEKNLSLSKPTTFVLLCGSLILIMLPLFLQS